MIFAEPIIKPGGVMVIASSCSEGIGSEQYKRILFRYSHNWSEFMKDILVRSQVEQDQWELEVQCRLLKKIGKSNLIFVTDGIEPKTLARCNVMAATDLVSCSANPPSILAQTLLDKLLAEHPKSSVAIIPDGPYILIKPASSN